MGFQGNPRKIMGKSWENLGKIMKCKNFRVIPAGFNRGHVFVELKVGIIPPAAVVV